MRAALFIPCITENFYPDSALSMAKVLQHLGVSTEYIKNQTCCGLPAYNAGHIREVLPLAKHFIKLFQHEDYVVAPSGSCVAMVRSFYTNLGLDKQEKQILQNLSQKVFEITEFIVDVLQVKELSGTFPYKVTYHDSCILNRKLGIREQPRALLKGIKDLQLVEMEGSEECCGFGGTFSAKFGRLSQSITRRKCKNIVKTGADYCTGADSSCLMNIGGYLKAHNSSVKTIHIIDLLARSLGIA